MTDNTNNNTGKVVWPSLESFEHSLVSIHSNRAVLNCRNFATGESAREPIKVEQNTKIARPLRRVVFVYDIASIAKLEQFF